MEPSVQEVKTIELMLIGDAIGTLKVMIGSENKEMIDLANSILEHSHLFNFEDLTCLYIHARNCEHNLGSIFINAIPKDKLDDHEKMYISICYLIGTLQKAIGDNRKTRDNECERSGGAI